MTVEQMVARSLPSAAPVERFVLRQAPCQRLALFAMDRAQSIMVWTFHHSMLDGRSLTLVLEDVFDHYDQEQQETAPAAPVSTFADQA